MNRLFFSFSLFFLCATGFAQNSGLGFNYQAVVRGADGYVLSLQSVELRFSLLPGQHATQASWVETHSVNTDAFGTFGVTVGKGEKAGGDAASFANVNFSTANYWLKVEIREGSSYRELSYSALTSVPYAEVANNVEGNGTFTRNFEEIRNELEASRIAINADIDKRFVEIRAEMQQSQSTLNTALNQKITDLTPRLVPPGTIVPFGGGTVPAGWLLCDGSSVSRTTYAALFAAIGTAWGYASTTTFNLPDLRGVFLRGVSGNSNDDADKASRTSRNGGNIGNAVGSYQEDAIRNITGNGGYSDRFIDIRATGAFYSNGINLQGGYGSDNDNPQLGFDANRGTSSNNPMAGHANGSDIRPKNVYVNYIIKF